jgi:ferric-dicitrate binding protein FerR (iron transport regulator)
MTTSGRDLLDAVAQVAREEYAQLSSADVDGAEFAELDSAELQKLARVVSESSAGAESSARSVRSRAPRRLPRPPARRLGLLAAAAAAVFGAGLWLAALSSPSPEPLAQQASTDASTRRLELPDGSTLALAEHTDARVVALDAREVRVRLLRGSVECDVVHDPQRRFVVEVGAVEVVVKGTRFTVSSGVRSSGAPADREAEAPEQLAVSVERGLVEVRQPPDRVLALLSAGQRWSSDGRRPPAPAPIEEASPALASGPEPEAPAPPAVPLPRERGVAARTERPSSASRLFEQADAARLLGRSQRAAAAFDELRRRYPTDARAGYAAFMLGRIRLDALDDAEGAAEAFAFAIAHPAGGFFLEDARARQVEALDRAGRRDECRAAREQFLKEHPGALRADSVAQLCGTR